MKRAIIHGMWLVVASALIAGCGGSGTAPTDEQTTETKAPEGETPVAEGPQEIVIWWAQWDPADGLNNVAKEFEKETGIAVRINQIPWASYQDQVFLNFGNNETDFDIVVGDSQWLGSGATKGLYEDITEWMKANVDLDAIHPLSLRYLCEYPTGSGTYYAAPCEIDATGFAYRKDWFEDPAEMAAFEAKYARPLAVPDTWDEFRDVAEFFYRPDEKKYGCVLLTDRGYDSVVMGFQQIMWAFGGHWGDPNTYEVQGHVNSPGSVEALTFMKELLGFAPPGGTNFDIGKCLEAFTNGSSAMQMNYFAFYPSIVAKMGDQVGFFVMPSKDGRRFASLGGQGLSISKKIPEARKELAKKFIAWFLTEDGQKLWIQQEGGFTSNKALLASDEFLQAEPYNAAFAQSLDYLKDFWNVPCYNELIATAANNLGKGIDGTLTPQEALDALAQDHENVFMEAGLR